MAIRILYHQEPQGWWAESPDIDGWSVVGDTYEEVRRLAEDGISATQATVSLLAGSRTSKVRPSSPAVQCPST